MIYFLHTLKRVDLGARRIPKNAIKIGYTGDLIRRVTVQIGDRIRSIELLGHMDADLAVEKALHQRFKSAKIFSGSGTHYCDWFRAVPELVEFINQNARLEREVAESLMRSRAFHMKRQHGDYLALDLSHAQGVQRGVHLQQRHDAPHLLDLIQAGYEEFQQAVSYKRERERMRYR